MKSLYSLITEPEKLTFNYFKEIKEEELFRPLIEIREVEADPHRGIKHFLYTREMIIQMILFVAHCYTKESPYLKSSDTVYTTKNLVLDDLEVDPELKERIMKNQIPELDEVIKRYILREDDEVIQELFIAKNIKEQNLQSAASAVDAAGNIDVKSQNLYFEQAEKYRAKIYQLQQSIEQKHPTYTEMKKDYIKNSKLLHATELIP